MSINLLHLIPIFTHMAGTAAAFGQEAQFEINAGIEAVGIVIDFGDFGALPHGDG